jgi:osmotically-inducible protein OsmY
MKKYLNNLVWLTVPMLLAVGCAETPRDSSVSYSPALSEPVTATSDRPEARAYPAPGAPTTATVAPPGASAQDWTLAEEIRSLLMSDRTLGKAAPMTAVVNNGVVTLQGEFRNEKERQRLHDAIAKLPGVQRVEDQLEHKRPSGIGAGETKNY